MARINFLGIARANSARAISDPSGERPMKMSDPAKLRFSRRRRAPQFLGAVRGIRQPFEQRAQVKAGACR